MNCESCNRCGWVLLARAAKTHCRMSRYVVVVVVVVVIAVVCGSGWLWLVALTFLCALVAPSSVAEYVAGGSLDRFGLRSAHQVGQRCF